MPAGPEVIPPLCTLGTRSAPKWLRCSVFKRRISERAFLSTRCGASAGERSAEPSPPRAHLWAAVLASSTPAPCIHVRTAFIPATMGSSFILLPLLWMLSWMPNIKTHLHSVSLSLTRSLSPLCLSPPFSLSSLPLLLSSRRLSLIALSQEQSGVGLFHTVFRRARSTQSKQKMRHVGEKKGSCQHPGLAAPHVKAEREAAAVNRSDVRAMKGESTGWECALSRRQSPPPRIKVQLIKTKQKKQKKKQQKMSVLWRKKTGHRWKMKHVSLFAPYL